MGYNDQDLSSFEKDDSNLAGHPVKNLEKGIEFSTGSLGMGISIAVGLCIAFKKKNKNKVFVVVGDGNVMRIKLGVLNVSISF